MKKLFYTALAVMSATNAFAETIVVIDDNGYVRQQMTTATTYTSPTVITQPVITTQPTLTVVRQTPQVTNSYYYDTYSTGSAFAAGVTTAVVGALLFDGFRHYHKKHRSPAVIHHHSGHKRIGAKRRH